MADRLGVAVATQWTKIDRKYADLTENRHRAASVSPSRYEFPILQ